MDTKSWLDRAFVDIEKLHRRAEFIKPLNLLKAKVGYGGLSEDSLNKAQTMLENNSIDFLPMAKIYLEALMQGIVRARNAPPGTDGKLLIAAMLYPAVQLKANGGMFNYPLVTKIADKLVQFLEVIDKPDSHALELAMAFHTIIETMVVNRITRLNGVQGERLMESLEAACRRQKVSLLAFGADDTQPRRHQPCVSSLTLPTSPRLAQATTLTR